MGWAARLRNLQNTLWNLKKAIVTTFYCLSMLTLMVYLVLHLIGRIKLNNLNFTLLLTLGIFTSMIFGELVLKDISNDRRKRLP